LIVMSAQVLLLRRAPRIDGAYDDEQSGRMASAADGHLALAFPPSTTTAMPLQLVPPAGGADVGSEAAVDETARVATSRALDPRPLAGPLAQAIAEVLAGFRPPQQLAQAVSYEVLALLERNAGRMVARGVRTPPRPRVTSIRLCEPRAGIAEVAAVIDTGARRRAMALRVEAPNGRWRVTVVRVG
jgi:hypothetical protein